VQITFTPASNSLTTQAIVLGDDTAGAIVNNYLPRQSRSIQQNNPTRAKNPIFYPRYLRFMEVSWTVERTHASYADAVQFVLQHADAVPDSGTLQVVHAGTTLTLQNCVTQSVQCARHTGVATWFQYTVKGSYFTNP